ncbi:MAG: hypothetical protein ACRDRV_15275 [Pseudonocardiaceae bacterium]
MVSIVGGVRGDVGEHLGLAAEPDPGGAAALFEIADVWRAGTFESRRRVRPLPRVGTPG